MYNSLPFNDVMINVKRYFIQDVTNCPNINDPLFLILRFNLDSANIYNTIYTSINNVFGNGNSLGNMIYTPKSPTTLDLTIVKNLTKKVVIIVESTGLTNYESSKLYPLVALNLGTSVNQIYRETDVIGGIVNDDKFTDKFKNTLNVLYPDVSSSSDNYDFVSTGINTGIQFIGMNAQTPDNYLTSYNNTYFNNYAIISRITIS